MIDVEIEPDKAGGYVLRVRDDANTKILLSSTSQSYANETDAERLAKRLFASPEVWSKVVGIDPPFAHSESVWLNVKHRDGSGYQHTIRGDAIPLPKLAVEIEPDAAGGYVFRVRTLDNGEILLSSTSQSYANPGDPEQIAYRLFAQAPFGPESKPEPVRLIVTYRDGTTRAEMIR